MPPSPQTGIQSVDGFAGAGVRAGVGAGVFLLSGVEDVPEPFDALGSEEVGSLAGLEAEPLSLDSELFEFESSDPASPASDFLPAPRRLSVL